MVASGLPLHSGVPLAVDATLVSPLQANGVPHPGAAARAGVALSRAVKKKRTDYPELINSPMLRLVVAAQETGGRLSSEARELVRDAAAARAREEPAPLRRAVFRALRARWFTMLSVAAQDVVAASITNEGVTLLEAADGPEPLAVDLWLDEPQW